MKCAELRCPPGDRAVHVYDLKVSQATEQRFYIVDKLSPVLNLRGSQKFHFGDDRQYPTQPPGF